MIIKPVAGILDGVSKITEGFSNTLLSEDSGKFLNRKRLLRVFYGKDKIYKAYSANDSWIWSFLLNINTKKYETFTFLDAIYLGQPNQGLEEFKNEFCLLMTLESLFLISIKEKSIIWKLRSKNIDNIQTETDSINVLTKQTKSFPVTLFDWL